MKITYTEYVADPTLRGKTAHLPAHIAQVLIAQGTAKEVPLPPRGSRGWLEAIQELDAMRTGPSQYDTVPPSVTGTEWSVKTMESGQTLVVKKSGSQTFWYDAPPADCPANVREQYIQLASINPGANAAALEAAKRAQRDYEAKVQYAKRW
jgi:hypothetical protein